MSFLGISTWLISFIAFAYTLLIADNTTYPLIYLLPFTLWILSTLFLKIFHYYKNSWVFKVFTLQAIVRYPLMATVYCIDDSFSSNDQNYNTIVIIFMVIELSACFITLGCLSKRQYNAYINKNESFELNQNYLFLYLILAALLVYMFINHTFSNVNFVFSLRDYVEKYINNNEELSIGSLGEVLFMPFKVLLALTIIQKVYGSKIRDELKKWIYLAVIIASSSFIIGISRFSLIQFTLPLLAFITMLTSNKEAKDLIKYSTITVFIALLSSSLAKFSRYGNEVTTNDLIQASALNAYFAGPDNIANGLAAYFSMKQLDRLRFILNDTFQNVPMVSKITSDDYKLNLVFNKQFYGHNLWADQIVPLSISGLFHFGWTGIPFYSCYFLIIAMYFERISYKSIRFFYKYVWVSLSLAFSYVFMMNVSSFYSSLSSFLLFLLIPFWLLNSFKVRKVM